MRRQMVTTMYNNNNHNILGPFFTGYFCILGCCCIDEFDKMGSQHQALLEAMVRLTSSLSSNSIISSDVSFRYGDWG